MSNDRSGVDRVNHDRKSRMDENRARLEARINEMKPKFNMDYVDPLHVEAPEGWTYRWLRLGFRDGTPDSNNETQGLAEGWVPVPADRHPEKMMKDTLGQMQKHNFLLHGNLMLCEMPTVFVEMKREKLNKLNMDLMRSMPGLDNNLGQHSSMPISTKGSELKISREYGFK